MSVNSTFLVLVPCWMLESTWDWKSNWKRGGGGYRWGALDCYVYISQRSPRHAEIVPCSMWKEDTLHHMHNIRMPHQTLWAFHLSRGCKWYASSVDRGSHHHSDGSSAIKRRHVGASLLQQERIRNCHTKVASIYISLDTLGWAWPSPYHQLKSQVPASHQLQSKYHHPPHT